MLLVVKSSNRRLCIVPTLKLMGVAMRAWLMAVVVVAAAGQGIAQPDFEGNPQEQWAIGRQTSDARDGISIGAIVDDPVGFRGKFGADIGSGLGVVCRNKRIEVMINSRGFYNNNSNTYTISIRYDRKIGKTSIVSPLSIDLFTAFFDDIELVDAIVEGAYQSEMLILQVKDGSGIVVNSTFRVPNGESAMNTIKKSCK